MHWMTRGVRAAVVIVAGALATACLTTPPAELESTSQVIGRDAGPLEPPLCERTPSCSLVPSTLVHPLQRLLGCGPSSEYFNGYSGGFMGGIASFCPDSADARTALRAARIPAYQAGFCTQCLTVPAGMLFVFWTVLQGPGCPSSCNPGSPPAPL